MKCYIVRGLSGSGKSTLAQTLGGQVFSTDNLFMVKGEYKFDVRLLPYYHEKNFNQFLNAIRSKEPIVVADCTFVTQAETTPYYVRAKKEGYEVEVLEPDNDLWKEVVSYLNNKQPCPINLLKQLAERNTHGVTIDIIQRRAHLWVPTSEIVAEIEKGLVKYDPSLPQCILVDIDGTVAEKGSRNAFDWARVGEDTSRLSVSEILLKVQYANAELEGAKEYKQKIIFFSGRDGVCYKETRKWLDECGFEDCPLYMRPIGDSRKDSIIKRELFDTHIRGKYNCVAVFDDRDQVVKMWRNELGLECLQVQEGDF
jgi:hypothetical protein